MRHRIVASPIALTTHDLVTDHAVLSASGPRLLPPAATQAPHMFMSVTVVHPQQPKLGINFTWARPAVRFDS